MLNHFLSVLSASTLQALADFHAGQALQSQNHERLTSTLNTPSRGNPLSMDMFAEDWNASQFWVHPFKALT
jgi:hypothetical protein